MAFLRHGLFEDTEPVIDGPGIRLRPYLSTDYPAWAELRALSRPHLQPWEPLWPRDDLTKAGYRRRIRHYQREMRDDLGYAFGLFESSTGAIVGGVSLSNLRRGVTQSAMLGYWMGLPHAGRGLMTEAVRLMLGHAFGPLRLHRIEAVTQPANTPSIRVLEKCGFTREGYLRGAIKINGAWADHVLYATLVNDGREAVTGQSAGLTSKGTGPAC